MAPGPVNTDAEARRGPCGAGDSLSRVNHQEVVLLANEPHVKKVRVPENGGTDDSDLAQGHEVDVDDAAAVIAGFGLGTPVSVGSGSQRSRIPAKSRVRREPHPARECPLPRDF